MHFIQTSGFHCTDYGIHVHEVSQWGIWSWNGRVSVPLILTRGLLACVIDWPVHVIFSTDSWWVQMKWEGVSSLERSWQQLEIDSMDRDMDLMLQWFTMLLLTLIWALTQSSPDFLPMYYFIQIKPYIPPPKGMKKYFCLKKIRNSWPQIICSEANMILATLRNFPILGVGVTMMDINQNVSIRMYLEYLLHTGCITCRGVTRRF